MTAAFRDIKADVRRQIASGALAPGESLPTEVELASRYGCARATVNRALRELAEEGILERRRKSGTRVRQAPLRQARFDIPLVRAEVESRGDVYRYALVQQRCGPAPDWLRARMGLPAGAEVLHVTAMHYAGAAPYQHEDRWINLAPLPGAQDADFSATGPTEWLIAAIPFSDVEISFAALAAEAELAGHLGCAPGDPVFRVERSTWFEGAPITFVRLSHPPGHRMTTRY